MQKSQEKVAAINEKIDRAEKMAAFTAEKLQDATVTFQQITEENGVYYADYLFAFTTDIARQADIAVG